MNHALLGLSPNIPPGPKEGDLAHDMSHEAAAHKRNHTDKGESRLCCMSNALPVQKKRNGILKALTLKKLLATLVSMIHHVLTKTFSLLATNRKKAFS